MRTVIPLTKALFAKEGQTFAPVTIPHTWNALDGQDGGGDYWRGIGIYRIALPAPTPGKQQYVEIRGANHVAAVCCNGRGIGSHWGGFSTFRFNLTGAMQKSDNLLTVAVSNAPCSVYPQRADFTFFGGLYRDVNLIEVPEAHFDLLRHGSDGVFVTADGDGCVRLDTFPVNAEGCVVTVMIRDASGQIVTAGRTPAAWHTVTELRIPAPHLWNGTEDPYCYKAEVSLVRDGVCQDVVTVTFGLRKFRVDPETGFWLNGQRVPLRGVSRHQDRQDKGWAISRADQEEDMAILRELGANTVRLAHYQHDQYFYDLCDRAGLAVWAEIPFISQFMPGEDAYRNTISQMTELIAQCYNHPSVFFWGIANEVTIGGDSEELLRNLRDLQSLCKSMDPSRLTTMAHLSRVPGNSPHVYLTDVLGYNLYYGWYNGTVSDNGPVLDRFHAQNPDRCLALSEYGADCLPSWHSACPVNHDYTEEYAAWYHHQMLRTIEQRPYLWGTYVWNLFDFAADSRDEGGSRGRNNKGLVTYDRKLRKDAFYLYQAYWSRTPVLHIAGRRFVNRAPEERDVAVYTNQERVTLLVNGKVWATQEVQDHAAVFRALPLDDGFNTVTALAGELKDTVTLCGVPVHDSAYDLPDLAEALQAGNWFDSAGGDSVDTATPRDGFFSLKDPIGVLFAREECVRTVRGWLMSREQLPLADRLTMSVRMASWRTEKADRQLTQLASVARVMTKEDYRQLDRKLREIRK